MGTLRDVANEVADELTSPNSNQMMAGRLMKWAPELVMLGQKLKNAAQQDSGTQLIMRLDVLRFAQKMAATMDVKDEEKGKIGESFTLQDAMMHLEAQYNALRQTFGPTGDPSQPFLALKHIIHLANFCMVAHNIITRPPTAPASAMTTAPVEAQTDHPKDAA